MPKKNILYVVIAIYCVCVSCENPKAPTWNTNINFPLLDTEYSFSEIIDSENPFQEDTLSNIISIVFQDDILKKSDSLGVDPNYFLTPEFLLDDISVLQDISLTIPSITVEQSIPFNNNLIDLTAFSNLGDVCISSSSIVQALGNNNYQETIEIDDVEQFVLQFFEQYNYITIDEAVIDFNLNDSNFPFPISLVYDIIGFDDDLLFNEESNNLIQNGRVRDEVLFNYSIFLEDISNNHQECSSFYNEIVCTQLGNIWLNEECFPNLNINDQNLCQLGGGNWLDNQCYSNISCLNIEDCCNAINGNWSGSECTPLIDGWVYNSENIYAIDFEIDLNIQSIENMSGTTKSIEFDDLVSTPLVNNFIDILGGEVSSSNTLVNLGDVNLLKFDIENNYILPLGISIELLNFKLNDMFIKIEDTISANSQLQVNKSISSSKILHYTDFQNNDNILPIDSIFMNVSFECLSDSGEFDYDILSNIDLNISNILIKPIEFEVLNAVVDTIALETPSLVIDNIPSGFQGVLFSDPSLIIDITNQISINNTLNLNIEAIDDEVQSETLNINANINYPINDQDSASTCIKLGGNSTSVYNGSCEDFPIECDSMNDCLYNLNDGFSLDDLLENSPNTLNVSGEALINGEGILLPDKYVWGDFKLVAPFSIVLGDMIVDDVQDTIFPGLNIIPAQSSILEPINDETKNKIDSSLINASITSTVINHTPIAGNISLLISSNENFFPLFIDSLINQANFCGEDTCFYDIEDETLTNIKEKLAISYDENELGQNFIDNIDSMIYLPMSNSDFRVQQVKFYSQNDSLWIGRLVNFELPYAEIDSLGNVVYPGEETTSSIIGPIQIDMINKSSFGQRYINSFISIESTYDIDGNGIIDINEDGIVNLHTTDFLNISSYVSFLLNTGGF